MIFSRTFFSLDYEINVYISCHQMLVVFKSAPILKRALKVRHAVMQLYILKLLKVNGM